MARYPGTIEQTAEIMPLASPKTITASTMNKAIAAYESCYTSAHPRPKT